MFEYDGTHHHENPMIVPDVDGENDQFRSRNTSFDTAGPPFDAFVAHVTVFRILMEEESTH